MTSKPDDQLFGQEHVQAYRESGGERGYIWKRGTTILLLTTKGSKSGEDRTTPLIYREDEGRYVIVASNGGDPDHPSWFKNMEASPGDVHVQVKDEVLPVRYEVAGPDERPRLWDLMNEVWPDYESYQSNTDREIPVVVLTPKR